MKTIQKIYETEADKLVELELGRKYHDYYDPQVELHNNGFLSTYDFSIIRNGRLVGFLEVKKKIGDWWKQEIIPTTKWQYAKNCPHPCYLLIERDDKALLFNVTDLIEKNAGYICEITRRPDQPEGSTKVVKFPVSFGKPIWYSE